MTVMDPDDVLSLLAEGTEGEALGPLAGRPSVTVHVGSTDSTRRCADALRSLPCVSVGVDVDGSLPGLVGAFDVLLTSVPDPPRPWVGGAATLVDDLDRAINVSPQASVVLAQLLRLGDHLDIRAALVAESLAYGLLQSGGMFRAWLAGRRARPPRHFDRPSVIVERHGTTLHVTLNRPEVRNAYDTTTRDELVDALRLVAADQALESVVLAGNGPTFSSGGDLSEFGTTPDPVTGHLIRTTRNAGWHLVGFDSRVTVTAHVHGRCIGAGVELPAFAHRVLAAPATTFQLPEIGMGLIPGAGGTASLPPRIGRHRTAWLALIGKELDTDTALTWGLIDEIRQR